MPLLAQIGSRRQGPRKARKAGVRLEVEQLESRCLLSASGLAPLLEVELNDTLTTSQSLGDLSHTSQVVLAGTIGNGASAKTDVDWSTFTLDHAAHVHLSTTGTNGGPTPLLGLYNSNTNDFGDPFNTTGYRQLAQAQGGLNRDLAAGTYYVALSGQGNQFFNPLLASSGYEGLTGDYQLTLQASDLGRQVTDGPMVLAADPAPGDMLDHAPLVLRLDFSTALDPASISPGQTVRLLYNANGTFGDGSDQDVPLDNYHFSTAVQELQLFPEAPLKAGSYQIILAGDSSTGAPVLVDLNCVALRTDAAHPFGQDYSFTFQVVGNEGRAPAAATDDTPKFAHDLHDLTSDTLVQASGVIGDDASYDPSNPDPTLRNPSADVDMYHFHISGPGVYAFTAEVFAGRIGSSLDPGMSLFELDPATGQLRFIDGNNNSQNSILATDGSLPLYRDSVLTDGLTAGDYYVAVSSNYNTPSPIEGQQPGTNGIFDPSVAHSGSAGFSTGAYVLNLGIQGNNPVPAVVSTSLTPDETLPAPPTDLVVNFSEAMNLRKLFFLAYEQTSQETVSAVYVEGADGIRYFPRLESYDDVTNQAHFVMLDGLANGAYQLHLSGGLGLTDHEGTALVGNDPSGDYVVPFSVAGPLRDASGDPHSWYTYETNDDPANPQDLGVLFPHEVQSGVTITRDFTESVLAVEDTADYYKIQVLQQQIYGVTLSGINLPDGVQVAVTDLAGNQVPYNTSDGRSLVVPLQEGTYLVRVDDWRTDQAAQIVYHLQLNLVGVSDNAPALTTGPAPALRLSLVGNYAAVGSTLPPQGVVLPPTGNGPSTAPVPGTVSIAPVSFQGTGVILPTVSLQELASGPLGGAANASGSSRLAPTEPVTFRLPKAPPAAVLLSYLATNLIPGSTAEAASVQVHDVKYTWSHSEAYANLFSNVLRPAQPSQERLVDLVFEMCRWEYGPMANPANQPVARPDATVPVADRSVSQTPVLAQEIAPLSTDAGQSEGPATFETNSGPIGAGVSKTAACLSVGLAGAGLGMLAYRRKKRSGRAAPPNRMRKSRSVHLVEVTS